jgi:16S rRNA C967 or C1407 C5-methylase (RsmB/RsmF family)/NOL1/NOP2/fmu family ribosome biogenesis protein
MRPLLGAEFDAFVASFNRPRTRGLRLNPAKTSAAELADLLDLPLTPVPWCPTGFELPPEVRLGRHPARLAGLFYSQEPSSMSPAETLAPEAGAIVVDLAASPGGKTTALADLVGPDGVVVANDVVGSRLRPLHDNLDLWGATNVVTVSRSAEMLAADGARFDAALLDAPCSGEALFRRSPVAVRQWSIGAVTGSARRQRRLLQAAVRLVRPGGALVYSTCTFETDENEARIDELIATHPEWRLDGLARLWPHRVAAEGQFIARLVNGPATVAAGPRPHPVPGRADGVRRAWEQFARSTVPGFDAPAERLVTRDDRAFLAPRIAPPVPVPLLARPGLPLGRLRPGRFEPHPALACAVAPSDVAARVCWPLDAPDLAAYLRGEAVAQAGPDGWVLVCLERWGLGWARRREGVLKNHLPTHLRTRTPPPSVSGGVR